MNRFDHSVFRLFNNLAGHSRLFDFVVVLIAKYSPLLFAGLFALYFFREPVHFTRRRVIVLAGLSGLFAVLVSVTVGLFVYRPRPFLALPPGEVHLLIPHSPETSFPSDHAAGSAAFAAGMWRSPDPSARWVFTVTAVLVGISRVIVGVHWPSDIAASFVLGGVSAHVVFTLAQPLTPILDWLLQGCATVEGRLIRRRRRWM